MLGGAGFLGSWVAETLSEDAHVTVVDRTDTKATSNAPGVDYVRADLADLDLRALVAESRADRVFHLAGSAFVPPSIERPAEDLERNALATLRVLDAVRGLESPPMVVFVSSAAVYGHGRRLPMDEEHPFDPLSPYGVSKLAAEQYVKVYAQLHGISCLSVRPFSLYGPRQRKLVVYDLLTRIHAGEDPLTIAASPEVSRDFVFVEDAARAIVRLAQTAHAQGEAYNIASGRGTTLEQLVTTLVKVTGTGTTVSFTGAIRPGDPLRWIGDPTKAAALGASCDTPLEAGLRRTNDWFVSEAGSALPG